MINRQIKDIYIYIYIYIYIHLMVRKNLNNAFKNIFRLKILLYSGSYHVTFSIVEV